MSEPIQIATRKSPLALKQTEMVIDWLARNCQTSPSQHSSSRPKSTSASHGRSKNAAASASSPKNSKKPSSMGAPASPCTARRTCPHPFRRISKSPATCHAQSQRRPRHARCDCDTPTTIASSSPAAELRSAPSTPTPSGRPSAVTSARDCAKSPQEKAMHRSSPPPGSIDSRSRLRWTPFPRAPDRPVRPSPRPSSDRDPVPSEDVDNYQDPLLRADEARRDLRTRIPPPTRRWLSDTRRRTLRRKKSSMFTTLKSASPLTNLNSTTSSTSRPYSQRSSKT